ncbi:hypothetical protein NIIDMKKI_42910 [Mycobacterium kansasii]|uniref:Uncharacterized protein n=1 Tax=Mycobacterium kansasii TaxID=1768 RepID=A0A7G1IH78_MYCKA|nr:hypothetical protein [Mycobacterium kansasii]BCI89085.1 hypothetical protein NIIDMKKI_42910 [Mycobacterium kansasii]VAZ66565.1 hypothetical protein LAUMK40_02701 [Mycobacterium kansasii]
MLIHTHHIHRRQPPTRISGHRHQNPLQAGSQISNPEIGKRATGSYRSEKKPVVIFDEVQAKIIYVGNGCVKCPCRGPIECKAIRRGDKIDAYPTRIPNVLGLVIQGMNRKSLMPKGLLNLQIDVPAEIGSSGP